MELWDLLNENREIIGEHVRGETMPEGGYHLVVDVWIRNREGKFIISRRAASRPTYPLLWECTGGSVLKGETSLEGALREVREEIGIDLCPENGRLLFTTFRQEKHDFHDTWLFEYDGEVTLDRATTDEVVQALWMSVDEINRLIDEGVFVPTIIGFFRRVVNEA